MYRDKKRFGQDPTRVIRSKQKTFEMPLNLKDPAKIFVCSWSDFFIKEADPWRRTDWKILSIPYNLNMLHSIIHNGKVIKTPKLDGKTWLETPVMGSNEAAERTNSQKTVGMRSKKESQERT